MDNQEAKDDDNKSITSQVLDYYKRHSHNRELSKYFCGTSEIKPHDWQSIPEHESQVSLTINIPPEPQHSVAESAVSPASSVASNRKLEWDNGADIGYSPSNIHKSISLPTLINNLECDKARVAVVKVQNTNEVINPSDKSLSASTSRSSGSSPKCYILSTSSSRSKIPSDSGGCHSNHLNSVMCGSPIAESTRMHETSPRFMDLNIVDKISRYKNMKVLKLAVSKTIAVECAGATEPLHGKNKQVQTSPRYNPSIAVQTDGDCNDGYIIKASVKSLEKQSVFYMCFADSDNSVTASSTIHTQTNSVVHSRCDSFEYIDGGGYSQPASEAALRSEQSEEQEVQPEETKQLEKPPDPSPLSTLIRHQVTSSNIKELQRSVNLMQKLINSKKYDINTKKYYVKKITQKILENNGYTSKSQSEGSRTSMSVTELESERKSDAPILSVASTNEKSEDVVSEPSSKSTSNDVASDKVVASKKGRLKRSPLLTLTDGKDFVNRPSKSEDTSVSQPPPSQGSSSSLKESEVEHKHRNWRDSKTNSEINFEQKVGDCHNPLINFAKKERDNQLYWINNEITHLSKLKHILEHNKKDKLEKIIKEPRIEDMKGIKRQSTVYVLSSERRSSSSRRSSRKCECQPPAFLNDAVVEIGNEKINLQNANLISSEEFTCNSDDMKRTTVVRRYTFDLPSENGGSSSNKFKTPYDSECDCSEKLPESESSSCECCKCTKNDLSCKCCPQCSCTPKPSRRGSSAQSSRSEKQASTGPKGPIIIKETEPSSKSTNLTRQLVLTDQITSPRCNCKKKSKNLIVAQCVPIQKKPNLTRNLVMIDNIPPVSTEKVCCDCSKPESCCVCSESEEKCCKCSESQKNCICEPVDESSSSSSECKCEPKVCCCCKQQNAAKPSGPCKTCKISAPNSPLKLLCYPCYQTHGNEEQSYLSETHTCRCYNISDTVSQLKKTIKQLENLESETELCKCPTKQKAENTNVCCKCNQNVKPRYRRRKGGLAYAVTIEPDENLPVEEKQELMESLQEIKIKIPSPRTNEAHDSSSSSSNSDKCSKCCCKIPKTTPPSGDDEELEEIVIQVPKLPKKKNAKQKKSSMKQERKPKTNFCVAACVCEQNSPFVPEKPYSIDDTDYSSEALGKSSVHFLADEKVCGCSGPCNCESDRPLSLQDYLRKNNPTFVHNADKRRKLLANLGDKRDQQKEPVTSSLFHRKKHKSIEAIFTTKEMKSITAKAYKKCREVQQKLIDNREREIKRKRKATYELFNKRLQEVVLKGRRTLPLEASIFNLR